jgi:DNA-binding transcriptional LysR family regulator
MTFRQLMAFAAVARHMNITKAAKEMRTSQPGLSKQLKTLQDDYGVRLFRRNGRRIELTEDGFELLNYIGPILTQLEKIDQRFLKPLKKRKSTELVLGGTYEVSSTILPSLIALFKKRYPSVQIVLRSNTIRILEQMMLKGDLELALTSIPPRSPALSVESCVPLKLIAFAAKDYPITKETELGDLETLPLIIRDNVDSRGAMETLLQKFRELGHRPNIAMRCESPEAIKAAVSNNLGVGILYEVLLQEHIAGGLFKQVNIKGLSAQENTYVLCHKERPLTDCAVVFLKMLRNFCKVENEVEPKRTPFESTSLRPLVSVTKKTARRLR